jgi:hypothetical protein
MKVNFKIIVLVIILLFFFMEFLIINIGQGANDLCYFEQQCEPFWKYTLTHKLLFK